MFNNEINGTPYYFEYYYGNVILLSVGLVGKQSDAIQYFWSRNCVRSLVWVCMCVSEALRVFAFEGNSISVVSIWAQQLLTEILGWNLHASNAGMNHMKIHRSNRIERHGWADQVLSMLRVNPKNHNTRKSTKVPSGVSRRTSQPFTCRTHQRGNRSSLVARKYLLVEFRCTNRMYSHWLWWNDFSKMMKSK